MKLEMKKLMLSLVTLVGSWTLGAGLFYLVGMLQKFASKAMNIPLVFTIAFAVLVVVYLIYWAKARKDSGNKTISTVFAVIATVIAVVALVLTFVIFGASITNSALIAAMATAEGLLLIVGEILGYLVWRV